jgi:hypothetical protein
LSSTATQNWQHKQPKPNVSGRQATWLRFTKRLAQLGKLFRDKPARTGAQSLLSKDGRAVYHSTQQLERFTEYFSEVFSSECVTAEQQQQMEQLIAQVETQLVAPAAVDSNSSDAGSNTDASSSNNGSSGGWWQE